MSTIQKKSPIIEIIKDCEVNYLLAPVKVIIKRSLPDIEIGSVSLFQVNEGDIIEIPRWIADIIVKMNFAEFYGENFDNELFRALSKERMQISTNLSTLNSDFLQKLRRQLISKKFTNDTDLNSKINYEKFLSSAYDLITIRTSKLLHLGGLSSLSADFEKKITHEEKMLFKLIHSLVENWKKFILSG